MMLGKKNALLSVLLVGACSGNPLAVGNGNGNGGGTGGSGGSTTPVPAEVAGELNAASYTATGGGQLKIDLTGLISSSKNATFKRAQSLDIASAGNGAPAYKAFLYQETALQRSYLAMVATNKRGNLVATSVSDGGQFNEHNSGGTFTRVTAYSKPAIGNGPEEGLYTYSGNYAGIFVPGFADDVIRPPSWTPGTPLRVTGKIEINGSFQDNLVEGGISNRVLRDSNGTAITSIDFGKGAVALKLKDLALRETAIDANGHFLGDVEFAGAPDNVIGNYAGLFGGVGASDVAGVLWLHPIESESGVWEYGAFNLPRCDLAGSAPLCVPR